jgi:hypothetical protein
MCKVYSFLFDLNIYVESATEADHILHSAFSVRIEFYGTDHNTLLQNDH